MTIQFYRTATFDAPAKARLLKRAETDIQQILPRVSELVAQVREEGDRAVARHLREIDRVALEPGAFAVTAAEFAAAEASVAPEVKAAIHHALDNVTRFHAQQMPPRITFCEVEPGVMAGEKITPVDSVGLYVPKGKGAFPSVMIMLGVPAKVAAVPRIAVCTPPNADGSVDAATLVAAQRIGIDTIFKVGGATAIAAFAYGTATIPKVAKILGPGNQYCSAAKRLLTSVVDVGLPAGPSESIILADAKADPRLVALDLLIEAEHGPDSAALLVTDSPPLAEAVVALIPDLVARLPEPRRGFCTTSLSTYGGVVLTGSLDESIEFVNEYAPEHMELLVEEPLAVLDRIRNAGEVLLGPHTPICVGNYCLGVNAILPTGGFAKSHSCTSVFSFLKRTSLAYCSAAGFERLRHTTQVLADYEGFPAHAAAVALR